MSKFCPHPGDKVFFWSGHLFCRLCKQKKCIVPKCKSNG